MSMSLRALFLNSALVAIALVIGTTEARAEPFPVSVSFAINNCVTGDCDEYEGGSVDVLINITDANTFTVTATNAIIESLFGAAHVKELGFEYEPGSLNGLEITDFSSVGTVAQPTILENNELNGLFKVDFGFDFQDSNSDAGRFNIGEQVTIELTTTSDINFNNFTLAAAHVGSLAQGGSIKLQGTPDIIALPPPNIPEPTMLLLLGVGLAGFAGRRRSSSRPPG